MSWYMLTKDIKEALSKTKNEGKFIYKFECMWQSMDLHNISSEWMWYEDKIVEEYARGLYIGFHKKTPKWDGG